MSDQMRPTPSESQASENVVESCYGKGTRVDYEHDALITYLDNATIINSCSLLLNDSEINPYSLLDLESFCQAFLLYDHVRTLVGSSFSVGFSGRYDNRQRTGGLEDEDITTGPVWVSNADEITSEMTAEASDFQYIQDLYHYLIRSGHLRPVEKGAGTVNYYIENIELLDEIASKIGAGETIKFAEQIFSGGLPWTSDLSEEDLARWSNKEQKYVSLPRDEAATRRASRHIAIGSDTWISDSYPIYYFSVAASDRKEPGPNDHRFGWEINNNRITTWQSTLVSQTFSYVIEASLAGKPFIGSSVRVPIISDLSSKMNSRFQMSVQSCLSAVDKSTRAKVETINRFFGKAPLKFSFLPAISCILQEARSKVDFIPALFRLKKQASFVEFRQWCRRAEQAWESEDIDLIYSSLRDVREAVRDLASGYRATPIAGSVAHLGNMRLITDTGHAAAMANPQYVLNACFSPGLTLIRDISVHTLAGKANIESLEKLFGKKITSSDRSQLSMLSESLRLLHPSGEMDGLEIDEAIQVAKMEVVMGDKFEGINVSGQGVAIGRGAQADVRGSTNMPSDSEALAAALAKVAELVRNQHGQDDADVEATLVEAAAKKARDGDESGAAGILKKSAAWVLDIAKSAGSTAIVAFLKSKLGIG